MLWGLSENKSENKELIQNGKCSFFYTKEKKNLLQSTRNTKEIKEKKLQTLKQNGHKRNNCGLN